MDVPTALDGFKPFGEMAALGSLPETLEALGAAHEQLAAASLDSRVLWQDGKAVVYTRAGGKA